MKKLTKILLFILCLAIMPVALMLTACELYPEDKVQVRVNDNNVQWSEDGKEWNDLISVDDLKTQLGDTFKGEKGDPGQNGTNGINGTNGTNGVNGTNGIDGREVEFQTTATHIQWRYKATSTQTASAWTDLVALEDIKGDDGSNIEFTITYDYNLPSAYINFADLSRNLDN